VIITFFTAVKFKPGFKVLTIRISA